MEIKKILVSQPQPQSDKSPYYDIAAKHKVEIVFRPFIKIEGLSAKEFRHQRIDLSEYTAVIFTSRYAIDNYFRLAEETRFNIPDTMRYFCVSESVALYLQKYIVYRKRKINFGATGKIDDEQLMASMTKNKKEKFLLPVSDVHVDGEYNEVFTKCKIKCTKAIMYRTVSSDFNDEDTFDYDLLLFFSPQGINALIKNMDFIKSTGKEFKIGTFGSATTKKAHDEGFSPDIEAPSPKWPSMPQALDEYLSQIKKQ